MEAIGRAAIVFTASTAKFERGLRRARRLLAEFAELAGLPPKRSFYIGRWQPLHRGHIALIQTALDEGREVVVGIMDTPPDARNPYTIKQRLRMFHDAFSAEIRAGRLTLLKMPWIDEVCYGRECGWRCREILLDPPVPVTATEIRCGGESG